MFFFFKQKTAYEMRISDWSSDVCSSDLSATLLSSVPILFPLPNRIALFREGAQSFLHVFRPSKRRHDFGLLLPSLGVGPLFRGTARRDGLRCLNAIGRASCRERWCQYV